MCIPSHGGAVSGLLELHLPMSMINAIDLLIRQTLNDLLSYAPGLTSFYSGGRYKRLGDDVCLSAVD